MLQVSLNYQQHGYHVLLVSLMHSCNAHVQMQVEIVCVSLFHSSHSVVSSAIFELAGGRFAARRSRAATRTAGTWFRVESGGAKQHGCIAPQHHRSTEDKPASHHADAPSQKILSCDHQHGQDLCCSQGTMCICTSCHYIVLPKVKSNGLAMPLLAAAQATASLASIKDWHVPTHKLVHWVCLCQGLSAQVSLFTWMGHLCVWCNSCMMHVPHANLQMPVSLFCFLTLFPPVFIAPFCPHP